MLVRGATAGVRGRVIEARAAIDEGKQAARQRERELRAENGLRQSS
jgi:microcompartment protein CcmL/EutN